LPEQQLEALLKLARYKRLGRCEAVVHQGDPGDSMMIVLSGYLRASVFSAGGREIILGYIQAGDVVGEIAVLDGRPRTATVTAEEPSELLVIGRDQMLAFLREHGAVALSVIASLCTRLRNATEMLSEQSNLGVAPRLARAILRLAAEMSPQGREYRLKELKIKQSDLGSYTGLARENVNRQLREWAEAGVLELGRGRLVIRQYGALENIAENLN
jgi:CRP-like cAMP-binding protein